MGSSVLTWSLSLGQELKFLAELSEITPQQLSSILGLLAGEQSRQLSQPQPPQPAPVPLPVQQTAPPPPVQQPIVPPPAPYSPPTNQFANASLNEKAPVQQHPPPPGPPPAYGAPGVLCTATALYAFEYKDPGDLELRPYDKIQVLKYTADECMATVSDPLVYTWLTIIYRVVWA